MKNMEAYIRSDDKPWAICLVIDMYLHTIYTFIYTYFFFCKNNNIFAFSTKNTNILLKHLTNRKIFAIIVV